MKIAPRKGNDIKHFLRQIGIFRKKIMELKVNLDYQQILNLVKQLPEKKIESLLATLQTEIKAKKEISKSKLQQLLLKAPTWSDEELEKYNDARASFSQSRLS